VKTLIAGKSDAEAYELIKHKLFTAEEAAKNPPAYKEQGMTCFAAKNNIWVNWKGELTPCGMFDHPAVPCLGASDGFASAWKEVSDRAESVRSNPECLKCSLRSLCPFCIASAYAETGLTGGKPTYLCEITKAVNHKMRHMIHQYSR
jgi:radical SAM protein with 4Fe4S-binding SPASM domain